MSTSSNLRRQKPPIAVKQGAATFYVVMFTATLVTVLVASFIRIILSESNRTINTDLSTSAYDSALAGVEDAKIALTRYHQCLGQGYTADTTGNDCERLIANFQQGMRDGDCDTVSVALERVDSGEVMIQEQYNVIGASDDPYAYDQAYTCVKINETTEDYRSTLDTASTTRLVPLWATNNQQVKSVRIDWYAGSNTGVYTNTDVIPPADATKIPALLVDFYQTDDTFTLGQLSTNNSNGTNHSEILLLPSAGTDVTAISSSTLLYASDKDAGTTHMPIAVACENSLDSAEFRCSAKLNLPNTFNGNTIRDTRTLALRLTLPFGGTTDFAITLFDSNGNQLPFEGIQAQVDSTGRANELFRRVEVRVDLIDGSFPFPEYTVQQTGTSELKRTAWVTNNCWTADGGTTRDCDNTGEADPGI